MKDEYTYWLNSDTPFFVIRQISFTVFEAFDHRSKTWKEYSNGFQEVSLNHECHEITEQEAMRIVEILKSTDTSGMRYRDLCALVRR